MSEFTYETENRAYRYETYEWDNTWIDHPNDDVRRILYIGDSISCGIRPHATEKTGGKTVFDSFGTSRAVDNPYWKDALLLFAKQEGRRDAILFNNGLHGWHLEDEKEYKKHYEEMLRFLSEQFPGTPVAVVLSTYIAKERDLSRVIARNRVARELAEKYALPVIDLYSVAEQAKEHLKEDGVHFTADGYRILAKAVTDGVFPLLG